MAIEWLRAKARQLAAGVGHPASVPIVPPQTSELAPFAWVEPLPETTLPYTPPQTSEEWLEAAREKDRAEIERARAGVSLFYPTASNIKVDKVGAWQGGYETWIGKFQDDKGEHAVFYKARQGVGLYGEYNFPATPEAQEEFIRERTLKGAEKHQDFIASGQEELLDEVFLQDILGIAGFNVPSDSQVEIIPVNGVHNQKRYYNPTRMVCSVIQGRSGVELSTQDTVYIPRTQRALLASNMGNMLAGIQLTMPHDGAERNFIITPNADVYRIDLGGRSNGRYYLDIVAGFQTYLIATGFFLELNQQLERNGGVHTQQSRDWLMTQWYEYYSHYLRGYEMGAHQIVQHASQIQETLTKWHDIPAVSIKQRMDLIAKNVAGFQNGNAYHDMSANIQEYLDMLRLGYTNGFRGEK